MQLVHDTEQEESGKEPSFTPLHDAPEEGEQKKYGKRGQQGWLPDKAAEYDGCLGSGIEQRGNACRKAPIVAASKDVCQENSHYIEKCCHDGGP